MACLWLKVPRPTSWPLRRILKSKNIFDCIYINIINNLPCRSNEPNANASAVDQSRPVPASIRCRRFWTCDRAIVEWTCCLIRIY